MGLAVKKLIVGQLQTNCYLLIDKSTNEALIIDPGDDADYIIRILQDNKTKPVKIIATHGHFDHILSVLELKLAFNIPFLTSFKDKFLIKSSKERAKHFFTVATDPAPKIDVDLSRADSIKLGKYTFKVIQTPGHTPGSICLYLKDLDILISGDTLFKNAIGRTDLSYSSPSDMKISLNKLFKLPEKTIVYAGHGEETTIGEEKNHF